MDQKNFAQSLSAFLHRRPFRPFAVQFVDGDRIVIEHPEAVRYSGQGTAVYFGKKGELTLFDHEGVAKLANQPRAAATA